MGPIGTVFAKEFVDNLRDRRSVIMAMVYPLIGPVFLGLMLVALGSFLSSTKDQTFDIFVENADGVPALVAYFSDNGVDIKPAPANYRVAIRNGDIPFVLSLSADAAVNADSLDVRLVADPSRISALKLISHTINILRAYEREMIAAQLAREGLERSLARPLTITPENVGQAWGATALFLNLIPPFLMFTVFIGGFYLVLDTTSGERERGSLEPLLINPVARWQLMIGKLLAALFFTLTTVIIQLLAFKLVLDLAPSQTLAGGRSNAETIAIMLAVVVPLVIFAVVLQMIIVTVTHSIKEAQTYLGLLPLIPAMPGLLLVFMPVSSHTGLAAIPTFGQTVLMGALVRGDPVSGLDLMVSVVSTLAVTAIMFWFAVRLYEREQLLFAK